MRENDRENDNDSAGTGSPAETTTGSPVITTVRSGRRRAASRPAGPPPEIDDIPAVISPAASATPRTEATGADRDRQEPATEQTETAQAQAEPAPEEGDEPAGASAEQTDGAEEQPETTEEQAEAAAERQDAEPAPPETAAEQAEHAQEAEEPAEAAAEGDEAAVERPDAEPAPQEPAAVPRPQSARDEEETAQEPDHDEPEAAEAAKETIDPVRSPFGAVSAVQTTEPSHEGAAYRPAGPPPPVPLVPPVPTLDVPAQPETPTVPSVTFQPPMVVFQPPQPIPKAEVPPKHAAVVEDESEDIEPVDLDEEDEGTALRRRRRRRRGGRGRGKSADKGGEKAEESADGEPEAAEGAEEQQAEAAEEDRQARPGEQPEAEPETAEEGGGETAGAEQPEGETAEAAPEGAEDTEAAGAAPATTGTSRRRRRRRRRSGTAEVEEQAPDDPPNTVVHVRPPRELRDVTDEVQAVKGSTRLEAKKQRRREGREQGRRRPAVITESEFLARRESVERVMVICQRGERTQIAVLEDGVLVEHYVDRASHQSYVGNVYLGKVQNVLPSMEAAFVDIGKGRNAVLYAGEVNWDVAGLVGQPRRIEQALKSGQSVLVQVTKDPVGHKGARLTSQISLPGRYLVYVPDGSMTGISRKLPDKERSRLKQVLKKIMPDNAGVIVRTAAEGATEEELAGDIARLSAQWEHIHKQAKTASAPALLHGEPDLTIRVVRDIFNEDFSKLVVSGDTAWDMVSEYVGYVAPHLAERLERWESDQDVLSAYRIDEQIAKALERKVWLPSGGSLVIDRTEAMTVVDVNTGKFTGQGGNLEETVTRNNLEAAEEIVRQLRLRDIGGIIVIDFIDMVLESNRDLVLRRMLECLARDRTKHQVAEVTSLGLVQMTRKRVGQGLLEAFSEPCECCNGRGIHIQTTPVEHGSDKSGGRRRKRKGDVERAVEEKLAKHEAEKRAAAKREQETQAASAEPAQPAGEPAQEPAQTVAEVPQAAPAAVETAEAETAEPPVEVPDAAAGNGRRRVRRSRAKTKDKAEVAGSAES
ncbi:Rne/Rng family ribonuclease [uncultured Thermomonospora sp.]|uniref:Rne/Rng family ribonuclease n=1 Tax=uncultured Thermomonospora sp. TaxID=671175 RepID=UPI00259BE656|nr:Rne/Rng family ribonuclease [uncultured Thermomonospora sp.]